MERIGKTLTGRLILLILVAHAVLLPGLFLALSYITAASEKRIFVDNVRATARNLADVIETEGLLESEQRILSFLESATLTGNGVFAELIIGERLLSSTLATEPGLNFVEDFAFGENGDNVYFLSTPVQVGSADAVLRLGFDESATLGEIEGFQRLAALILAVYLAILLTTVIVQSIRITEPLRRLQEDSRRVASGDYEIELETESRLWEIEDLTNDLNIMRRNLVAINSGLQQEIAERQRAESQQKQLESRLNRRQRLESIGTLAGGIAHEFNNILLPIILYAELALEDVGSEGQVAENLRKTRRLAERAKRLVEKILQFSHQVGAHGDNPADLVHEVGEALDLVRALVPASIEIDVSIDPACGFVSPAADELQQVTMNLCINAYRAMSDTGGTLGIRALPVTVDGELKRGRPDIEAGEYVRLSVSDTGPGIDPEVRERIFEPFFTTRSAGTGTGLGLSVAHGIVAGSGGTISVETSAGSGTTFHVYLPRVEYVPTTGEAREAGIGTREGEPRDS